MRLPKFLYTCFFVFSFLTGISICQSNTNGSANSYANINIKLMAGADIRSIVQAQIDSARARDYRGEIKSCMFNEDLSTNAGNSFQKGNLGNESFIIENLRFLLIVGFSIIAFLIVFIRRVRIKNKKSASKKLKDNIRLIREEGNIDNNVNELNLVRSKLVNQSASDVVVSSVTKKAKGLKIGKGEVMLAAKIKSYQLAQFGSNKVKAEK